MMVPGAPGWDGDVEYHFGASADRLSGGLDRRGVGGVVRGPVDRPGIRTSLRSTDRDLVVMPVIAVVAEVIGNGIPNVSRM